MISAFNSYISHLHLRSVWSQNFQVSYFQVSMRPSCSTNHHHLIKPVLNITHKWVSVFFWQPALFVCLNGSRCCLFQLNEDSKDITVGKMIAVMVDPGEDWKAVEVPAEAEGQHGVLVSAVIVYQFRMFLMICWTCSVLRNWCNDTFTTLLESMLI